MAHERTAHAEHHILPVSLYLTIFGALMVGTAITVAVAFVDLGAMNLFVALIIAVVKATLVVLYFMHAKYSERLTQVVIGCAAFWLVLLIGGILHDYFTRVYLTGW